MTIRSPQRDLPAGQRGGSVAWDRQHLAGVLESDFFSLFEVTVREAAFVAAGAGEVAVSAAATSSTEAAVEGVTTISKPVAGVFSATTHFAGLSQPLIETGNGVPPEPTTEVLGAEILLFGVIPQAVFVADENSFFAGGNTSTELFSGRTNSITFSSAAAAFFAPVSAASATSAAAAHAFSTAAVFSVVEQQGAFVAASTATAAMSGVGMRATGAVSISGAQMSVGAANVRVGTATAAGSSAGTRSTQVVRPTNIATLAGASLQVAAGSTQATTAAAAGTGTSVMSAGVVVLRAAAATGSAVATAGGFSARTTQTHIAAAAHTTVGTQSTFASSFIVSGVAAFGGGGVRVSPALYQTSSGATAVLLTRAVAPTVVAVASSSAAVTTAQTRQTVAAAASGTTQGTFFVFLPGAHGAVFLGTSSALVQAQTVQYRGPVFSAASTADAVTQQVFATGADAVQAALAAISVATIKSRRTVCQAGARYFAPALSIVPAVGGEDMVRGPEGRGIGRVGEGRVVVRGVRQDASERGAIPRTMEREEDARDMEVTS